MVSAQGLTLEIYMVQHLATTDCNIKHQVISYCEIETYMYMLVRGFVLYCCGFVILYVLDLRYYLVLMVKMSFTIPRNQVDYNYYENLWTRLQLMWDLVTECYSATANLRLCDRMLLSYSQSVSLWQNVIQLQPIWELVTEYYSAAANPRACDRMLLNRNHR